MMLLGYLLSGLSELFILHYFLYHFLKIKPLSRTRIIVVDLIYLFVTISQVYLIYIPNLTRLISILMKLFVTTLYFGSLYQRMLIALSAWLGGTLAEGTSIVVFQMVLGRQVVNDTETMLALMPYSCALSAVFRVLYALLIAGVYKLYKKHKPQLYHANLLLIVTFISSTFVLIINFGQTKYLPLSLMIILLMLVSIGICFDMFKDQLTAQRDALKSAFLEEQLADQLAHYEALYQQMQKVRAIRHDMKNILINMDSYLALGEIENARGYLRKFQNEITPSAIVDTGAPLIDAVLTAKRAALAPGELILRVQPLACEHLDLADVGMLLATALDNAVEGSAGLPAPAVTVTMTQQARLVTISIQNPTNNVPTAAGEFPRSTKPDPENHGYGLKSIKRIAEKWHGSLSWSCENGIFTLRVVLQDLPA